MKNLLVATAKGLVQFQYPDDRLTWGEVHFLGFNVTNIYHDTFNDRTWAGIAHKHWGQKLHYSEDGGRSWHETTLPKLQGKTLPNGKQARLRQVWCFAQGGVKYPERLWMGTDPGALFISEDHGRTFQLVETLWNHESRQSEGQWFGAGSDYPFIHSIIVDPKNADHILVAVSCAGVFESWNSGQSWRPINKGLIAAYLPNPNVEVGHDPHILLMADPNAETLWQQNHCGIFNSKNGGKEWQLVSKEGTVPHYGFAMTIDQENPNRAWVIPAESDERRIAPDLRLQVFKTEDFGVTWEDDSEGLPKEHCFDIVLRQAFDQQGDIQAFGTTNGNLFFRSGNEPWQGISAHLTKVNALTIV